MQCIIGAIRGYVIVLCGLGGLLLVLGGFRLLFEVTGLGSWFSHYGAFQLAVIVGIAAFYTGMTKYEKTAGVLAIIAGLSGFFALGALLNGY
ncbi:hypothetical protein [[Curtobacterium] plantarum]|uniref:hypothetical protein n=1 Tax=[Curtobacterium] plantarum TaxID=221276 RepID=UPI000F087E9D|nr:hypothetical protein [[Curtobacterium] plantarum]RNA78729.1 hypothetical protein EBO33_01505 [[Curtobacterium] plantarum]